MKERAAWFEVLRGVVILMLARKMYLLLLISDLCIIINGRIALRQSYLYNEICGFTFYKSLYVVFASKHGHALCTDLLS